MDTYKKLDAILTYMKQKGNLSELEKDIVSTIDKYIRNPFDRNSAERRVLENNMKYADMFIPISALPGIECKSFAEMTDDEMRNTLYLQTQAMWAKVISQ